MCTRDVAVPDLIADKRLTAYMNNLNSEIFAKVLFSQGFVKVL